MHPQVWKCSSVRMAKGLLDAQCVALRDGEATCSMRDHMGGAGVHPTLWRQQTTPPPLGCTAQVLRRASGL